MKAVIPAAGEGSRLHPLTDELPKALVQVGGRPLIEHVFDPLIEMGVDELVLVVGYRKAQIIERYSGSYGGIPITYVCQREQLGLAHALLQTEPHIDDDFIVLLGDNVFHANLPDVVDSHRSRGGDATILIEEVSRQVASRYGVCRLNESNEVIELVEKPDNPPSNWVMTGFYLFSPAIFPACRLIQPSERGEHELPDAINLLLRAGRDVNAVRMAGWRVDIGYPEDRDEAETLLADSARGHPELI